MSNRAIPPILYGKPDRAWAGQGGSKGLFLYSRWEIFYTVSTLLVRPSGDMTKKFIFYSPCHRQSIPPTNYLVPPTNYLFLGNPRGEVFHSQTKVGPHTD
jgi:hypothetical protein